MPSSAPLVINLEESETLFSLSNFNFSGLIENNEASVMMDMDMDTFWHNLENCEEIPNNQMALLFADMTIPNFLEPDVIDFVLDEEGDELLRNFNDDFIFDDEGDEILRNIEF